MMRLRENTLTKLKCSACDSYLSSAPVFLTVTGESLCGRCPAPAGIRNTPYEVIAENIEFPCRYGNNGCTKILPFIEIKNHEENCHFQELPCPIVSMKVCPWIDTNNKLLDHCQTNHLENILPHPCNIQHSFLIDNLQTFLTKAFNLLFLIHTKICLASNKLFHCVRLIGDPDEIAYYNYILRISSNENETCCKNGNVVSYSSMNVEENNSLIIKINSLKDIFNSLDKLNFCVTINKIADYKINKLDEIIRCYKCRLALTNFVYHDTRGWLCTCCCPRQIICNQKLGKTGNPCTYEDINIKVSKHIKYFCCNHHHNCEQCNRAIGTDIYKDARYTLCCLYYLKQYRKKTPIFNFEIYSRSIKFNELSAYTCLLEFTNICTKEKMTYTPEANYEKEYDWIIQFEMEESDSNAFFDVKIDLVDK